MPFHHNRPPPIPQDIATWMVNQISSRMEGLHVSEIHRALKPFSSLEEFAAAVPPELLAHSPEEPPPWPTSPARPEYAFERWDYPVAGASKELRPVECLSVREWVARLPAGHGTVPEIWLESFERVLADLNMGLRESIPELVSTM